MSSEKRAFCITTFFSATSSLTSPGRTKNRPSGAHRAVRLMSIALAALSSKLEAPSCAPARPLLTIRQVGNGPVAKNGERSLGQPTLDEEHTALESQVRECYGRCA